MVLFEMILVRTSCASLVVEEASSQVRQVEFV